MMNDLRRGPEFHAIHNFYGDSTAKRSGVPLINHINEGLVVLQIIQASEMAMAGFCLHPLFQADAELVSVGTEYANVGHRSYPVLLAMEYRRVANLYLSHCLMPATGIELSPMKEVNDMLIADKIQNRKDFEIYHQGTHLNSDRLTEYFREWLHALGVSEDKYQMIKANI